jgi:SAM-dependent methyltransferase
VQQRPGKARGRLAFRDDAFDLVVSRHEAFVAAELRRVLRTGGTFVTQAPTPSRTVSASAVCDTDLVARQRWDG